MVGSVELGQDLLHGMLGDAPCSAGGAFHVQCSLQLLAAGSAAVNGHDGFKAEVTLTFRFVEHRQQETLKGNGISFVDD